MYDVVIVGGGPAGLSAALVLGRCRRSVLVCDSGRPRNAASGTLHGFLSRDGIAPAELLRIGREELGRYGVECRAAVVAGAQRRGGLFRLRLKGGGCLSSRRLILATGVVDDLPKIPGLNPLYGRGVFHCPYCDGWEVRDRPLAAYGRGSEGFHLARELLLWSADVLLCTDGDAALTRHQRTRLSELGVCACEEPVERLEGEGGELRRIVFAGGKAVACRALFFSPRWRRHSDLAERLGCRLTDAGTVEVDEHQRASVPGVFVAGDAAERGGMAIMAAAEGARAAVALNADLLREDQCRRRAVAGRAR